MVCVQKQQSILHQSSYFGNVMIMIIWISFKKQLSICCIQNKLNILYGNITLIVYPCVNIEYLQLKETAKKTCVILFDKTNM